MLILIASSTWKLEENIIYQQFLAKIEEEEEVGVLRRKFLSLVMEILLK